VNCLNMVMNTIQIPLAEIKPTVVQSKSVTLLMNYCNSWRIIIFQCNINPSSIPSKYLKVMKWNYTLQEKFIIQFRY
jgi:hypothetical protein